MKFKQFLNELGNFEVNNHDIEKDGSGEIIDAMSDIKKILAQMDARELDDFGDWLYDEIFDDDISGDDAEDFDYDELIELISSLESADLDYVLYMLGHDEIEDDFSHYEDESENELEEKHTVKLSTKNRNHKKNKRFSITKAQFRAGKAARKKDNRKNKAARKKDYRKNKVKIKKYAKSYNAQVKSGKHIKKIRK